MAETWKSVPGFEGRYEVSDQGGVRSLDRTTTWKRRNPGTKGLETLRSRLPGKLLKPQPDTHGYLRVRLGPNTWMPVHCLMLEAFVGPRPLGEYGRHLDDDPKHNQLNNLCWGTPAENVADAQRNGLRLEGAKNPVAKLGNKDILAIKALHGTLSNRKIGEKFGVSHTTVNAIVSGKRYRDAEGDR